MTDIVSEIKSRRISEIVSRFVLLQNAGGSRKKGKCPFHREKTPSFYIDGELIDFGSKNGGQITVNGKDFSWDHSLSNEEFDELILNIVDAKLAK